MRLREPPTIASWLLKRFVPVYRSESLLGDLLEEYQSGRTSGWYWRETLAALIVTAKCWVRTGCSRRRLRVFPTLVAVSAFVVSIAALSLQYRHLCPPTPTVLTGSIILGICAAVAEAAIALSAWLCSLRRPARGSRRSALIRRSIVAFTAIGLGSGALTWASTTSCPAEPIACPSSVALHSCSNPNDGTVDGR